MLLTGQFDTSKAVQLCEATEPASGWGNYSQQTDAALAARGQAGRGNRRTHDRARHAKPRRATGKFGRIPVACRAWDGVGLKTRPAYIA
jgi:hypothetical protein